MLLGWKMLPSVLLGGVTWISSSGIISKVLAELKRGSRIPRCRRSSSILVFEDLAMAVYLPVVAVLDCRRRPGRESLSRSGSPSAQCLVVLFVALRFGQRWSAAVAHESDEIVLLTTLRHRAAGRRTLRRRVQVSAAIGAFLVGIAVSGPIAEQSHRLLAPLRDLFAAVFFFFFGLQIEPATAATRTTRCAVALAVVTAMHQESRPATGRRGRARRRLRADRWRAGAALVARGEFSMVIAGLGTALEPALGPFSAAYILMLAIAGPVVARLVK